MSVLLPKQQEVLEEAVQVLWQHMPPFKSRFSDFCLVL